MFMCNNFPGSSGLKNPPAMQEMEDPLEREMAPTPAFLPGKPHGQRSLAGYSPWGHKRVRHNLATKQQCNN